MTYIGTNQQITGFSARGYLSSFTNLDGIEKTRQEQIQEDPPFYN